MITCGNHYAYWNRMRCTRSLGHGGLHRRELFMGRNTDGSTEWTAVNWTKTRTRRAEYYNRVLVALGVREGISAFTKRKIENMKRIAGR